MRKLRIRHTTTYEYPSEVTFLPHKLLFRPREGHYVRIDSSLMRIEPEHQLRWHRDVNDNSVAVVHFKEPSDKLVIASEIIIENRDDAPLDFLMDTDAVTFPFDYDPEEERDLIPFQQLSFSDSQEVVQEWITQFWKKGEKIETYVLLDKINKAIKDVIWLLCLLRLVVYWVWQPGLSVVISMLKVCLLRLAQHTLGRKFICQGPAGRALMQQRVRWLIVTTYRLL